MDTEGTVSRASAPGYGIPRLRKSPELTWIDSAGRAVAKTIRETAIIGTTDNADIVLSDRTVSRLHAELDPREDGLWVRDLQSRNGTYLDKIRVGCARIPTGAVLLLGQTELRVEYDTEPAEVELWPNNEFAGLVGVSTEMRELFARLQRIAQSPATVLVEGETGTGKELVAKAIHDVSERAAGPFVVIDCAALPENLLEAELFGHARNAFTGALSARAGAIEQADGGSVFLDEIGELPLAMQPKLLRVLESRTLRRLGESHYRPVDVRFISATHRDLRTMVNTRAFREDLYFRLAVLPVKIPPLRERPADIAPLLERFMAKDKAAAVPPELLRELMNRPWFGNVRELRNFVERASAFGAREALAFEQGQAHPDPLHPASPSSRLGGAQTILDLSFSEFRERAQEAAEREYLSCLLERHQRNVTAAAAAAGVNRTYLHRLIAKYRI